MVWSAAFFLSSALLGYVTWFFFVIICTDHDDYEDDDQRSTSLWLGRSCWYLSYLYSNVYVPSKALFVNLKLPVVLLVKNLSSDSICDPHSHTKAKPTGRGTWQLASIVYSRKAVAAVDFRATWCEDPHDIAYFSCITYRITCCQSSWVSKKQLGWSIVTIRMNLTYASSYMAS